ncbi:MAG: DNA polymerase II large subunit [Candidatus Diapherotrites archaeon]|uniref:DNA polymerase II large subunit n=1 Tax=Candidatus Iainarchaeum sp. TaxID=3101447 RepID=A0A2D6M0L8_9ARCH|nr:DNA polymerase II large subunit [Candidatus Diapherotrites archaeon]|tara:strand:- start:374 stop:3796 length:3423 start_codon:yes stop_codon:yes gene_type:complete
MQLKLEIEAEPNVKEYYKKLAEKTLKQFDNASKARAKGFDVSEAVETVPVADLADRTENIIGPKGIAKRYREAMKETKDDRLQAIFKIFKEMIEQKWCKIEDPSKRVEQAIKTALVLNTEGVVVAPLDGVPQINISKNPDGTPYINIYYAGPIRAAGGTSQVLPLILGDYARELMDLDRYKPTGDEVERCVEECQIYEELVSRQYKPSDDEVRKIIKGCPVCINGEPTEEREVAVHRNLSRIPTNRVRGGMCLVISEGVGLKAKKILKFSKTLGLDWSWLEEIIKVKKQDSEKLELSPNWKYLEGTAAGRPILSYPMRPGGFRIRYGRARNMGLMGKGMHPATMYILNGFVATATQIKVERPGKAAGMAPVDSIEGPIVRLLNGDVVKVETAQQAQELKRRLDKILFLGDLLVSYGDFRHSAHPLIPAGYCSEWWKQEGIEQNKKSQVVGKEFDKDFEKHADVSIERAFELSSKHGLPLHPNALFYYSILKKEELAELVSFLEKAGREDKRIVFEKDEKIKELLERIGVTHTVKDNKIFLDEEPSVIFENTFGFGKEKDFAKIAAESNSTLAFVELASGLRIRDKAGTFIGSRMGRPEASRPRKMVGNPHVLFPIGLYGGNTRSLNKAMESSSKENGHGKIEVAIALHKCPKCKEVKEESYCHDCKERTIPYYICPGCGAESLEPKCKRCNKEAVGFNKRSIDLGKLVSEASQRLGVKVPDIVKGVKGTINQQKIAEPLEKGILRAKYDLHVFRDATIRYEIINAPLTHFKPVEIGTSIEKLHEMGYTKDVEGKELENVNQLVEILPQDIVIHDEAGDFFVIVTKFIDDLLEKYYGLEKIFRINTREELVGELLLGLAPHTSAAIVGRVVGYTKARACFAHPYFHQTKRRNIDGDQDSLMLLMDGLLNFSHSYLPASRGGRMDAPLVFTVALKPTEIDDECYNMETCNEYPLELYERALKLAPPEIDGIETVNSRLGKKNQYSGFGITHKTSCFDCAPTTSKYVELNSMEEKIKGQAKLQNMIAAVDGKDALERVMVTHFMPDIIGNARSFSRQTFRCTNCNERFRRPPLNGKCTKCGKDNIILTIHEGSVRKYIAIAKEMTNTYQLSDYLKQRIELIEQEIDSIFCNDKVTQKNLFEYV